MEIKVDQKSGRITAVIGKGKGMATEAIGSEDALALSKQMKAAAFTSNRIKKLAAREAARKEQEA